MTQRDYELQYGQRYQDKKQAKSIQLRYAKAADLSRALNQIKTNLGRVVADEASNTLVLIDAPEKLKEMEEFIQDMDLPLQTRVFGLNYAQADKIGTKIQEAVTKGVGSIKIDERTNKIAVTDYPQKLVEIAKIISAFDEKTPQVLIDAQIIEIRPSDKFEMGVDWDYWIKKHFDVNAALPISTTSRLFLGTTSTAPANKGDYKAILDLLRTIGDTKILSSPRIMALNNQEAKILVGSKDAYITSTVSQSGETAITSQTVNFVDVGIKLYVTPTINRDGFVTMKIKPEISTAKRTDILSEGKVTQIPIVTTSESETTVMVKDGVTLIIGGLKKDQRDKTVEKIPLLGDIPVVGFFFRRTSDEMTKAELVILITPHIMSGEKSFTDFAEMKPKDGAVAKMVNGNIVMEEIARPAKDVSLQYYRFIIEKLRALTSFGQPKGIQGTVEMLFTLDSQGQLKNAPKVISFSNQELVSAAIDCIKYASPFPPFPEELKKPEESFHVTLEYK
jgi:TonB family protein